MAMRVIARSQMTVASACELTLRCSLTHQTPSRGNCRFKKMLPHALELKTMPVYREREASGRARRRLARALFNRDPPEVRQTRRLSTKLLRHDSFPASLHSTSLRGRSVHPVFRPRVPLWLAHHRDGRQSQGPTAHPLPLPMCLFLKVNRAPSAPSGALYLKERVRLLSKKA